MTNFNHDNAYVWIWLPDKTEPVVAGKLEVNGAHHDYFYGKSYLNNPDKIALSKSELPLLAGERFTSANKIHHVIHDSLPDAWGRRVLSYQYHSSMLSNLDMLLLSSSNRIGALHFQTSSSQYNPLYENHGTLNQLHEAATLIEKGAELPKELGLALLHGTSIGGARPKAFIEEKNVKYIAKFSSSTDLFPIVQAEFAAMWLGRKLGLQFADVRLQRVAGKYVLLVQRFDRVITKKSWSRKFITSALTLLNLDETEGRYASYLDLADEMRRSSANPIDDLHELFRRIVFNILVGNTDDHAKNHAFFWNGNEYALTPAYDVCPYLRVGQEATQAMVVGENGSLSQLSNALSAAPSFELSHQEAQNEIDSLVDGVNSYWVEACEQAELTKSQREQLTGTAVLNPYCFYERGQV